MPTVPQLVTACQVELQDPNGIYFDDALVEGFVLEGLANFAEATRCLRTVHTGTLAADTAVYDLSVIDPAVLEVLRVWVDGRELEYLTGDQMACQSGYPDQKGLPRCYTRETAGFGGLRVFPAPDDDYPIVIDHVQAGHLINGVTPAIPPEFHDALKFYALARLCGSDIPIAQQAKATQYAELYKAEVERCTTLVKSGFQRKPAGSKRAPQTKWLL